jgi:hypothetical protein
MTCKGFQKLKVWTAKHLEQAIGENKWYLSEQGYYDVGMREAEEDFLHRYVQGCGAAWRVEYCGKICESRGDCELGKQFIEKAENLLR